LTSNPPHKIVFFKQRIILFGMKEAVFKGVEKLKNIYDKVDLGALAHVL